MGEVKFTKDQADAVNIRNKNIIVSAQAGAGKTQVLVGRIIALLKEEKIDIRDMLIVTFTNKAAREMKDRIKRDLSDLVQSEEISEEDRQYFQKQYNNTNQAQISTMHSFGINILRKYFYKLGLNPSFKLLTDTNSEILKWESLDQVFDQVYQEKDPQIMDFFDKYSKSYSDQAIKEIILRLHREMLSQVDGLNWVKRVIDSFKTYDDYKNNPDLVDKYKADLMPYFKPYLDQAITDFYMAEKKYKKLCEKEIYTSIENRDKNKNQPLFIKNINIDREIVQTFEKIENYSQIQGFLDSGILRKDGRVPYKTSYSKKLLNNEIKQEVYEEFSNLLDEYRTSLTEAVRQISLDLDQVFRQEGEIKRTLEIIYGLLNDFVEKFQENKAKKDALDFNDIEHMSLKLLEDQEVVGELREKYKYIFFDEYQDSNQLQNEIINRIKGEDNLFFVGDKKQSIYKFRLADPKIFQERYDTYSLGQDKGVAIDLDMNFRTEKVLLEFNNFLLNKLMTNELGDIDYTTGKHALNPGRVDQYKDGELKPAYDDSKVKIELDYVIKDTKKLITTDYDDLQDDKDDNESDISELSDNKDSDNLDDSKIKEKLKDIPKDLMDINAEALLVADKIEQMLARGRSYKDIVILARSNYIFQDLMRAFDLKGIPHFFESAGFDYSEIELDVFINLLKAVNNDTDDIVLMTALSSSLVNLTDDELAQIRIFDNKLEEEYKDDKVYGRNHSFNYCVRNYVSHHGLEDPLANKLREYFEKIKYFRSYERTSNLKDLAWHLLVESGHMAYVLGREDGDKKLENIKLFINEIGEIEEASFQTLSSFIKYLEVIQDRKMTDRESRAELSEEDNVVRMMSMHKSKGLQFKVVFLVDLNKKFSGKYKEGNIIVHDQEGVGIKLFDNQKYELYQPFMFKRIADVKKKERDSEEMRLLYVALTRAEEELHLVSSIKQIESSPEDFDTFDQYQDHLLEIKESSPEQMASFHKWIYYVINNPDYQYEGAKPYTLTSHLESDLYLENFNKEEELVEISGKEEMDSKLAGLIRNKVDRVINFEFDNSLNNLPYKKTVTQIAMASESSLVDSEKLESEDSKDKLDDQANRFDDQVKEGYYVAPLLEIKPRFVDAEKQEFTAFEKGNLYHILFEKLPFEPLDEKAIEEYLDSMKDKGLIDDRAYEFLDKSLFTKFISDDIFPRLIDAESRGKLFREESFTMKHQEGKATIYIDGQIDLFFEEEDGLVILDFKTNKKIDEDLYKVQLDLYAEGLEKATGKKVKEKLIYWVMHGLTMSI